MVIFGSKSWNSPILIFSAQYWKKYFFFFFFFFLDYKLGKVQMSQSESWFEKITENKDNSCFLFDGASRLKSI